MRIVDCLGVRHPNKWAFDHELQPLQQTLIDEFAEQRQVLGAMLQGVFGHGLDEFLPQIHVPLQVAEGHLGFDHPKLGRMARGIGILGAESGAEGIDVGEGAGERLAFQLAADGEVSALAEEIGFRFFVDVALEGGDPEHLARAFAIARGDDRRVHVNEIALLEELVDGVGQPAAHAENGAEEIRPRPQVGDGAQEFVRVPLFLKRIGWRRRARSVVCWWRAIPISGPGRGRGPGCPSTDAEAPVVKVRQLVGAGGAGIDHHLDIRQAGAVVQFHERKTLWNPAASAPSPAR